jgi:hypothetical protein
MRFFNKIVFSKKEPTNKNDIWFDGSNFKVYTESSWEAIIQNNGGGGSVLVDDVLTDTSVNPVTSKGIKQYVDLHPQYEKVDEIDAPEIGLPSVVVDEQLSTTSTNPVQNKIITEELQRIKELAESGVKTITLYAPEITNMSGSGEENEAIIREFFTDEMIEHNKAELAVKDVRDSIIYIRGSEGALIYQGYIPKDWDGETSIDVFPMHFSGLSLVPAMLTIGDMIPEDTDTGDFDIGGLAVVVNYSSVDLRELMSSMDASDAEFLLGLSMLIVVLLVTGIRVTYDGEDLGLMAGIYGALDNLLLPDVFDAGICIPVIMSILQPNVFIGTLYIGSRDYIRWFPVNTTKYQDIADAALCGALIPNQKYTISDYETVVDSDVVRSSEFRHFNVVVTAKTRWELEETALATTRGTDEERNVFTPIYGEFRLKYRLNPNKKDFPWITENAYIDIDNTAHPNSIFGTNTRFYKTPLVRYRNGETYHIWLEKLEAEHWLNRAIKSLYTKVETPSVGDVAYTIEVDDEGAFTITNVFVNENPNKGFIYEMEDMYGNQAPWDFFNLEFKAYEYSDGDYGFKRISFNGEKSGNSGESWYPTFYDHDLTLTGYNSGNLCNIRGEAYKEYNGIPVYFSFRNNKIYGHSKDGAVILTTREIVERGDDAAIAKYNMRLENVTINGGNIIAQMYCNSTINKGCNNLEIYAVSDEDRLNECSINILSGVKGTPENPLVVSETFAYYAPFAYVGMTSTGEIKIWNPANLVNN